MTSGCGKRLSGVFPEAASQPGAASTNKIAVKILFIG
jgi:hypothetical protein